jgi:hypothetical protein
MKPTKLQIFVPVILAVVSSLLLLAWLNREGNVQRAEVGGGVGQVIAKQMPSLPEALSPLSVQRTAPEPAAGVVKVLPAPVNASESVVAFREWARDYFNAEPKDRPAMRARGRELAEAHRVALKTVIQSDPQGALVQAVPMVVRQDLPAEIVEKLERRVNQRGKLMVLAAVPQDNGEAGSAEVRAISRSFTPEGLPSSQGLDAYVYGDRARMRSLNSTRVSGVEVDGMLAVLDSPIRVLEEGERPDSTKEAVRVHYVAAQKTFVEEPMEEVSSHPSKQTVVVEDNRKIYNLCCAPPVDFAAGLTQEEVEQHWKGLTMAEGGAGGGIKPFNVPPGWTNGTKSLLYLRVAFPESLRDPQSEVSVYEKLKQATDFLMENSFGRYYLTPTVAPLVVLPYPMSWYNESRAGGEPNGDFVLREHALEVARRMGYDTDGYDLDVVEYDPAGPGSFGGLAYVGGKGVWLKTSDLGVLIHELGHNLGLFHANRWETLPPNTIGPGRNQEYGNSFDVMGAGGAGAHFNAYNKASIGWLTPSSVHDVKANGTYRVYQTDQGQADSDKRYALSVNKDSERDYWFEFRQNFLDVPVLSSGLLITWSPWGSGGSNNSDEVFGGFSGSHLLDVTPGSGHLSDTRDDAGLPLGRTYSDPDVDLHVTSIFKSKTTPPYVDVVVNRGPFPGNRAPSMSLSASAVRTSSDRLITLTASGTDPDGDAVAYSWDFGDGSVSTDNARVQKKSWTVDGEYQVLCTVSDMKGKRISKGLLVTVGGGVADQFKVSGTVRDALGDPIEGVYMTNRALVSGTSQANPNAFRYAYTDSNGNYTLTNLPTGSTTIFANLYPLALSPDQSSTFQLTEDRTGRDWTSSGLVQSVEVVVTDGEATEGGGGAEITLTRANPNGILNVQVMLGSQGTAQRGLDYTLTPAPAQVLNLNNRQELRGAIGLSFANNVSSITVAVNALTDGLPEGVEYAVIEFPDTAYAYPNTNGAREIPFHVRGARTVVIPINDANSSLPVVSFEAEDPNMLESGDKGVGRVRRTGPTGSPLTVNLDYAGEGTVVTDFASPATVEIPAGQDSVAFDLTPVDDLLAEGTENITVSVGASLDYLPDGLKASGAFFLADNDQPTLTVKAVVASTTEGSASPGKFTITRAAADIGQDLVVDFSLGGTALSGSDYKRVDGVAVIPANELSVDILIESFQDTIDEANQTVILRLATNEDYAITSPGSETVTIIDNDSTQFTIQSVLAPVTEPGSDGINRNLFVVSRPAGGAAVTVRYRVATSSTVTSTGNNADYEPLTGELEFAATDLSLPIQVRILADNLEEPAETLTIELLTDAGYRLGAFDTRATATILDEDQPLVDVSFADQSALTNVSEGAGQIRFFFSRTGSVANSRQVNFTLGGTADLGVDYTIATTPNQSSSQVTISDGDRGGYLNVVLINDALIEGTETLTVTVSNSPAYGIRFGSSTVTIDDNDAYTGAPPPIVGFVTPTSAVDEKTSNTSSNHQVAVSLNQAQASIVTVQYRIAGGSATGRGVDYTFPATSLLEFQPGQTSKNLPLPQPLTTTADSIPEGDETILLELLNATGANIGTAVHTVTIKDTAIPEVLTDALGAAAHLTANLRGRAMPNNRQTDAWFEWGTSPSSLKNLTPVQDAGSGTTFFNMTATITGLTYPGTYYYRAVADNDQGISKGIVRTIRTLAPPTVVTLNDAGHTASSITLAGTVNPNRGLLDVWFEWGPTPAFGNLTPSQALPNETKPLNVTATLSGLMEGDVVYYRLVAMSRSGLGTVNGDTKFASAIPYRIAGDLIVHANANHATAGTANWLNLGLPAGNFVRTAPTSVLPDVHGTGVPGVYFNGVDVAYELAAPPADIIGADARTIEVWAFNPGYGMPDTLFNMGKDGTGTQVALSHSNLTQVDGAFRHGTVATGNAGFTAPTLPPLARWNHYVYVYDGKKTATLYVNGQKRLSKSPGVLATSGEAVTIGAARDPGGVLQKFMHGYVNSVRIHGGVLAAADVLANFNAGPTRSTPAVPVVATTGVSNLTPSTAILNGLANPSSAASTAWIEWGTSTAYDNASPPVAIGAGQTPVPVVLPLTNLVPGVTYHFRAVASNAEGTSAGEDVVFVPQTLATQGRLWVDLRAHEFTGGATWSNAGALGDFDAIGAPTVASNVAGTGYPGVQFDGTSMAFKSQVPADLDFSFGDDQTLEVWVLNPTLDSAMETVVNQGRVVTPASRLRLSYGTTGGVDDNNVQELWAGTALGAAPQAGQWTHLAIVVSGSTRTLYVNGVAVANSTHPAGVNQWDDPVLLGATRDAAGVPLFGADGFSGFINSVRIHGGAMVATQVQSNYLLGPAQAPAAAGLAPVVATLPPTLVSDVHATLAGTVLGGGLPTSYWFEWGLTAGLGNLTPPAVLKTPFVNSTVTGLIGGLSTGQTIHYRIVAENAQGQTPGTILTLLTNAGLPGLPKAQTNGATNIVLGKATLNGVATTGGVASQAWFEYGPTPSLGLTSPKVNLTAATVSKPMVFTAAALPPHTTHYFRMVVENGNGLVAGSTLSFVSFNSTPIASAGTLKVLENATVPLVLKGSDADKEPLTFAISTAPAKGVIGGSSPNFTYTSAGNLSGVDTFQFTVTDGVATSAPAAITVTITPVNDAPIAPNSVAGGAEDTLISGNVTGTDEEGDVITAYAVVTPPQSGVLTLNGATGAFDYQPEADFFGVDSFQFRVTAGGQNSLPGTVTLNVTGSSDTPIAVATGVWTDEDTDVDGQAVASDPDNDVLTFTKLSDPADGTVTVFDGDGFFTYEPDTGFVGTDSFTFKVNDGSADSNTATVTITVGGPIAYTAQFSGVEDELVVDQLEGEDPNSLPLTFTLVTPPENGTLTLNPDGQFQYNPKAGFTGVDHFVFKTNNGTLDSNPATATFTITKRPPDWIWMQGPNVAKGAGVHGTQGVSNATNLPGARADSASWVELDGTLWVFGGQGYGADGKVAGLLNDLWKRDAVTGEWTWVSGAKTVNGKGSYGAQGVAMTSNQPGARSGAASWTGLDGKLWLFGGNGFDSFNSKAGLLNDLWRYDPLTGEWTWMKGALAGNANGTYGAKGAPSSTGTPGGRHGVVTWVDAEGSLWLFGGQGRPGTGVVTGQMGDLWKYNPAENQWAWVSGGSGLDANGVYGQAGGISASTLPGGRSFASGWRNSDGVLYLFGGFGRGAAGTTVGYLNDVWAYYPESNRWSWLKGSAAVNALSVQGLLSVPDVANTPGGRSGSMIWSRGGDEAWLFGGLGKAGHTNDFWRFDTFGGEWTCLKGAAIANAPGVYGAKGAGAPGNTPGARRAGVPFPDPAGDFWLLGGGNGAGAFNDMWKLDMLDDARVATLAATAITDTDATLNGEFEMFETEGFAEFRVWRLGDLSSEFYEFAGFIEPGSGPQALSLDITGLDAGAAYGVQAILISSLGVNYGQPLVFTTMGAAPPLEVAFATYTGTGVEGDAMHDIEVVLGSPAPAPFAVPVSLSGDAISGLDYGSLPSVITFTPGQSSAWISIPIVDDGESELDEEIVLTLGAPTAVAALGLADTYTLTLSDNDEAPVITTEPISQFAAVGGTVNLTVAATGSRLKYQWKVNDKPILDATTSNYSFKAALTSAGLYTCLVSNDLATSESDQAEIYVVDTTPKTVQLTSGDTSFTINAAGPPGVNLVYRWRNGIANPLLEDPGRRTGTQTATLTFTGVQPSDSETYLCRVSKPGLPSFNLFSGPQILSVPDQQPAITTVALPTGVAGAPYSFQVQVDGDLRKRPASYRATGLPKGLTISATTGIISGRPTLAFSGNVTVFAKNSINEVSAVLPLEVLALPANTQGTFVGLLPRAEATGQLGGRVDLSITPAGDYTLKLTLNGYTGSAKGTLVPTIVANAVTAMGNTAALKRKPGQPDLSLAFSVNSGGVMTATLTDALTTPTDASGTAGVRRAWAATPVGSNAPNAGDYTLLLELGSTDVGYLGVPQGNGFATFKLAVDGRITGSGRTADGLIFTVSTILGPNREMPLFAVFAPALGSLHGVPVIDLAGYLGGSVSWSKGKVPPGKTAPLYVEGFDPLSLTVMGGRYPGVAVGDVVMDLDNAINKARLNFFEGGLLETELDSILFSITNPNPLKTTQVIGLPNPNPNKLSFALPATPAGSFNGKVTVLNPEATLNRNLTFQGVLAKINATTWRAAGFTLISQLPQPGETLKTSPVRSAQVILDGAP